MSSVSGMIRTMAAVPYVHLANPKKNAEEISALLDIADQNGAFLCVFPELSLTGMTCGDLFMQPALLSAAQEALHALLEKDVKTVFVVGLPVQMGGRLYNCAAVIACGELTLVPMDTPGCAHWFAPAACAPDSVCLFGETIPVLQNPVFDCAPLTI